MHVWSQSVPQDGNLGTKWSNAASSSPLVDDAGVFHRWIGRFYLLSVGIGSIAGLVMSLVSKEGTPTHWGFGILAVLWFFTGLQGYLTVRRGDIPAHRHWMIRNFALTLAAVTLRNYLPLMLFGLHWSFRTTYVVVSWLCWVPNLLVAEWMVQHSRRAPVMIAPSPAVFE